MKNKVIPNLNAILSFSIKGLTLEELYKVHEVLEAKLALVRLEEEKLESSK